MESKADSATIASLKAQIEALDHFKENYEKKLVMQESYDKRLNILIHGVTEEKEKTLEKFQDFLKNGLKIEHPMDIEYVDIHRLPQYPIQKHGRTVHRPVIVKLLTMNDKNVIFENVKHLKNFNRERQLGNESNPYVYVTEHLPLKFQQQKKQLMPLFIEARKKGKK